LATGEDEKRRVFTTEGTEITEKRGMGEEKKSWSPRPGPLPGGEGGREEWLEPLVELGG